MKHIKILLLVGAVALFTACGGGGSGDIAVIPSVPTEPTTPSEPTTPVYSAVPLGEYKISLDSETKLIVSPGCANVSVYDEQEKYYEFTYNNDEILPAGNYDVTFSIQRGYSNAKSNLYHHSFDVTLKDLPIEEDVKFAVAEKVLYKLTVEELEEYILNFKNTLLIIYDANYDVVLKVGNLNGTEQVELTEGTYYIDAGPYSCLNEGFFNFDKI